MSQRIVLELPGKGAYAPNKFGCLHGDFIKTNILNSDLIKPIWIFGSRVYDPTDQKDAHDFNEMCAKVIPHCHQVMRMPVVPRIFNIVEPEKVAEPVEPVATLEQEQKPTKTTRKPKLPKLIKPPSGG